MVERKEGTTYCLSLSYGKDSMATIEACRRLGYPIDRIIHAEIWFNEEISADLPPMVEFKEKADKIIKDRYGIQVEHICATNKIGEKVTYEKLFYKVIEKSTKGKNGIIRGFPLMKGPWCNSGLKMAGIRKAQQMIKGESVVQYIGIAADEPERIERQQKNNNVILPLVDIGWDEAYCRKWCEENGLLSPIYTTRTRGGCWFCHNQRISGWRELHNNYPKLWEIMLKLEQDSPPTNKIFSSKLTLKDYDLRFKLENQKLVPMDGFRWEYLKNPPGEQLTFKDF